MFRTIVLASAMLACSATARAQAPVAKKVLLSPRAENTLSYLFSNLRVEFAFCAYGKEESRAFVVERVELAYIYRANKDNVDYEPCRKERGFLADGHSHMDADNCKLSMLDRGSTVLGREKYTLLICTEGRYELFSKADVEKTFTKEELEGIREAVRHLGKNHGSR